MRAAGVLLVLAACATGCLTVDATIKSDGSATLDMTYACAPNTSAAAEKTRYSSDHVTVDSVTFTSPTNAVLKARVDDVTKMSSAEGFKSVTVTRGTEDGVEKLTVVFVNPLPAAVKDEGQAGPKITLHLPGPVKDANHDAKVSGDTVTWSFSFVDWMKAKSTTLEVRWAAAAKAAAGEAKGDQPKGDAKPAAKEPAASDHGKAPSKN